MWSRNIKSFELLNVQCEPSTFDTHRKAYYSSVGTSASALCFDLFMFKIVCTMSICATYVAPEIISVYSRQCLTLKVRAKENSQCL